MRRYTKSDTINAYGTPITVYRTIDGKVGVEVYHTGAKGYWWVKLKTIYGVGGDGALNLPDDHCLALADMFRAIHKEYGV